MGKIEPYYGRFKPSEEALVHGAKMYGSEKWPDCASSLIFHQRRLWRSVIPLGELPAPGMQELRELRELILLRKGLLLPFSGVPGRSFIRLETITDWYDLLNLLAGGSSVGYEPVTGCTFGFVRPVEATFVESVKEGQYDIASEIIHILYFNQMSRDLTVIDPSGNTKVREAFLGMVLTMNLRAGKVLRREDIIDIVNHIVVLLGGSAKPQVPYGCPGWAEMVYKSKASLVFYHTPSVVELADILRAGDVSIINASDLGTRGPWFRGTSPDGSLLLGNHTFCSPVTMDLSKYNGLKTMDAEKEDIRLLARAAFRLTLGSKNHNATMRLCAVSLAGLRRWDRFGDVHAYKTLKRAAVIGANSMADELNLPRPMCHTTVTLDEDVAKVMDSEAGIQGTVRDGGLTLDTLDHSLLLSENYCTHGCGTRIRYTLSQVPSLAERLITNWKVFISGDFNIADRNLDDDRLLDASF